jgi:diaminohydroxyphosphoribosylaminopyrimidine deaminase/5-amino-6-(5-phosphoribosylamino)uracil reductase
LLEEQARQLIAPFTKRVVLGLPFVIAKWAATIDGATATHTGDSQWISNEQSRKHVHRTRGRVDAIMVGIRTVVKDDPLLTARDVPVRRIARRVVVDPRLRMPERCRLVASANEAPLTIASAVVDSPKAARLRRLGIELVSLGARSRADGTWSLRKLLKHLAMQHDATNVLVEGGAGLVGSLHQQG